MQATSLLTLAGMDAMPDDGVKRELLHGELIEGSYPKAGHYLLSRTIWLSLESVSRGRLGAAFMEAGYSVHRDDRSGLKPDVSFLSAARLASTDRADRFQGAPDIAFEVISPSEKAEDVEAKLLAYLETGSEAVVHVYPAWRRVRVFLSTGEEFALGEKDTLRIPSVLPGWELPLLELFQS